MGKGIASIRLEIEKYLHETNYKDEAMATLTSSGLARGLSRKALSGHLLNVPRIHISALLRLIAKIFSIPIYHNYIKYLSNDE